MRLHQLKVKYPVTEVLAPTGQQTESIQHLLTSLTGEPTAIIIKLTNENFLSPQQYLVLTVSTWTIRSRQLAAFGRQVRSRHFSLRYAPTTKTIR